MYAEVSKWFTDSSGLGLTVQSALLMNPKAASREEDIAEVIETWDAYRQPAAFKKVALKSMLVSKIRDNYELWEADKSPQHFRPTTIIGTMTLPTCMLGGESFS